MRSTELSRVKSKFCAVTMLVSTLSVASIPPCSAGELRGTIRLLSPDFVNGGAIPRAHEGTAFGCRGQNVPVALSWTRAPKGTRSLALTMIDTDAPKPGGFLHWLVYNIPPTSHSLNRTVLFRSRQGQNDAGSTGYVGPCPPPDSGVHDYQFTLYALNVREPARGLNWVRVQRRVSGHVLGRATMVGTFARSSP